MSKLLTGGKTKYSYLTDIILDKMGILSQFTSKAMMDGKDRELLCYNIGVKSYFKDTIFQSDKFISIDDRCGASPDVIGINKEGEKFVLDIKCPKRNTFFKYKEKDIFFSKNNNYYCQLQMQMMSTNSKIGYLFFGLFKSSEKWGDETWIDYKEEELPFEDKFYYHEFSENKEIQEKILEEVEKSQEILFMIEEMLMKGYKNIITPKIESEFYREGFILRKFTEFSPEATYKLKDEIFYCLIDNEFYVKKKIR